MHHAHLDEGPKSMTRALCASTGRFAAPWTAPARRAHHTGTPTREGDA
ncbi:hypothetical protein ACGFW5_05935 [Streptomyces sp. NPDC048416]